MVQIRLRWCHERMASFRVRRILRYITAIFGSNLRWRLPVLDFGRERFRLNWGRAFMLYSESKRMRSSYHSITFWGVSQKVKLADLGK